MSGIKVTSCRPCQGQTKLTRYCIRSQKGNIAASMCE